MIAALMLAGALGLPDPALTPGVRNPDVTQTNIADTICKDGWTATIRPPLSYTDKLKREQMAERGLSGDPRLWEEDHFLPLEIGGDHWLGSCFWVSAAIQHSR